MKGFLLDTMRAFVNDMGALEEGRGPKIHFVDIETIVYDTFCSSYLHSMRRTCLVPHIQFAKLLLIN